MDTRQRSSISRARAALRAGSSLFPLFALANAATAQAPVASVPKVARDGVLHAQGEDGALWARGATYKARFGREGFTYVPFLGSDAPTTYPIEFRLASAACGGVDLAIDAQSEPKRQGDHIAIERGAFTERYDLTQDSVEQSFVFDALPGTGELELELAVESVLQTSDFAGRIEFTGERGKVGYSSAVAVDALGKRADCATRLENGRIAIRVPADFLAGAALPVVVDPVIATFHVATTLANDHDPDVAAELTSGRLLTTYCETFSQNDHDVYGYMTDTNGNNGSYLAIELSTDDWNRPRVASNRSGHSFLMVAQVGAVGSRKIRGVLVDALLGSAGSPFTISTTPTNDTLNPAVGGDPRSGGTRSYCVVWERVFSGTDHDIHGRLVNGAGTPGLALFPDDSSGTLDAEPAISKSNGVHGTSGVWTVVWQRKVAAIDHDIYGARIDGAGSILDPTFLVDGHDWDSTTPSVSSPLDVNPTTTRVLVASARFDGTGDTDIGLTLLSGHTVESHDSLQQLEGGIDTAIQSRPDVDSDGTSFLIAYHEYTPAADDAYVTSLAMSGGALYLKEGRQRLVVNQISDENLPQLASLHGAGFDSTRTIATFEGYFPSTAEYDVWDAILDSEAGGPVNVTCTGTLALCPCGNAGAPGNGCGNSTHPSGGHLAANGAASVALDSLVLTASGLPSGQPCMYVQGTNANAIPFGDGIRCAGGTVVRLGVKTNPGGSSAYPGPNDPALSVRGSIPALGATRTYQVWYRDPANYCTPATFNFTNALEVSWTP